MHKNIDQDYQANDLIEKLLTPNLSPNFNTT
jgi:hypothetical protein